MLTYYDLGDYSRPITTQSPEAQMWFDRGLVWCYGYNHDEAIRCFEQAATHDPACAMAQWGIAYAAGPNYNKQWKAFDPADLERSLKIANEATLRARDLATGAGAVEQSLIGSLIARYPSDDTGKVSAEWNEAYALRMREVYRAHPDDHDVAALFAEAIMNRTPWQLWDIKTGKPATGADTAEAITVLQRAMALPGGMRHPGLLHMYFISWRCRLIRR